MKYILSFIIIFITSIIFLSVSYSADKALKGITKENVVKTDAKNETKIEQKKIQLTHAPLEEVKTQIKKVVPVNILYDETILSANDKKVIDCLYKATKIIDDIFLTQVYSKNNELKQLLQQSTLPEDKTLLEAFNIAFGPFYFLGEAKGKPFLGNVHQPKGANFYPEDMTKEEFNNWIKNNPKDKEAFESSFTVIKRDKGKLIAVPYTEEYKTQLTAIAELLKEASKYADNPSLKKYLLSRAEAFSTNDYFQSDKDWVDIKDSSIEVVIGPYEVYTDEMNGLKAAFESFVTIVDPEYSKKLQVVASHIPEMEKALPIEDKYKNPNRGSSVPIKVVQEVFTGGDTKAGVQTLAFNLPNDERVREEKGFKNVLLINIAHAKFDKILMPIAGITIREQDKKYVDFEPYFMHTLFHECSHGLGPGNIVKNGVKTNVNKELKELYSTIEECKADTLGLYFQQYFVDKGYFKKDKDYENRIYISYLAGMFRSIRFGIGEAHGGGVMIQYNYFTEKGGLSYDKKTQKYIVDFEKIKKAIRELGTELLMLEANGDYDKAKSFISKYKNMTPEVKDTQKKLENVPIDIRPIYAIEQKMEKK